MAQQGIKKPTGLNEENKDIKKGSFEKNTDTDRKSDRDTEMSEQRDVPGQGGGKENKGFRVVKENETRNQSQGGMNPDGQGITAGRMNEDDSESADLDEDETSERGGNQSVGNSRHFDKEDESKGLPNQNP